MTKKKPDAVEKEQPSTEEEQIDTVVEQPNLADGFGWIIKIVQIMPPNARAITAALLVLLFIVMACNNFIIILERQGVTVPYLLDLFGP